MASSTSRAEPLHEASNYPSCSDRPPLGENNSAWLCINPQEISDDLDKVSYDLEESLGASKDLLPTVEQLPQDSGNSPYPGFTQEELPQDLNDMDSVGSWLSYPSQRTCSKCGAEEASLSVSLLPCHGCRTAFYCCHRHRQEDMSRHDCPKTISDRTSFSRNCYVIFSQRQHSADSFCSIDKLDKGRTQELLELAHKRMIAAEERTAKIHKTIKVWNADIATQLERKPAPFSESPLRVLHPSWELINENGREETTSFVALSYCWRDTKWSPVADSYKPPGAEDGVPICRCLWEYLFDLLDSDEEAIWIDQLCLDQTSDLEKRSAVASMDSLYSSARLVFVAIEDIVLDYEEVKLLSEAFQQVSVESDWTFSAATASNVFAIVQKIFSARWFSRAWCFHEYHLSKDRVIAVPCYRSPGSTKLSAIGLFNFGEFVFRLSYFQNEKVRAEYSDLIKRAFEFFGGQDYAFSNIIANSFHYGCKHPEDKLSIALNICQLDLQICSSLLTSDKAPLYLLVLALAAGDATILTTRGPKVQYDAGKCTSWLHWPNETSWSTRHPFPLPKGISSLSLDHIIMDLHFLPTASLQTPSRAALKKARKFLLSKCADHIRKAYNLQELDAEYQEDKGTLETLACALTCGVNWIVKAWRCIREEVTAEVEQSFETVKQYKSVVLTSLFAPRRVGGEITWESNKRPARLSVARTSNRSICVVKPPSHGSRAHALIAEHRRMYLNSVYRMVLCIMLFGRYWEFGTTITVGGGTQQAMSDLHIEKSFFRVPIPAEHKLYSSPDYSFHPRDSTVLAVPRVLESKRFNMSDRLWLLEPVMDRSGLCWRVREKVGLLGCPINLANANHLITARKQKIVG